MSPRYIRFVLLAAMLVAFAACSDDGVRPVDEIAGLWGGEHLELRANEDGTRLMYDCAVGTVRGPLRVDAKGNVSGTGTHIQGHGGPYREGEDGAHPAWYSGHVDGDTMTFRVRFMDTGQVFGPYTLIRGERGYIYLCV